MAEQPDSEELPLDEQFAGLVPQQLTDLNAQESGPQGVPLDNPQGVQTSHQSESEAAKEVSAQALPSRKLQALIHHQTAVLLLQRSSTPLHLAPGTCSTFPLQ